MRIIFAGTPETAVPSLQALIAAGLAPVQVLTRPDAPLGRKRVMTPSPVAAVAEAAGIPVLKTSKLDDTVAEKVAQADLGVIVAYGGLVKEPLLSAPRLGWVNLHFSELPRWRGAAPVQRAIMAGESTVGLSVFRLVAALDAGPMIALRRVTLDPDLTSGDALALLAAEGATFLTETVIDYAAGRLEPQEQSGEPSYAEKLERADGYLDWHETAEDLYHRFRGVTPEPGAFGLIAGQEVKLHEIRPAELSASLSPAEVRHEGKALYIGTGKGTLQLLQVQPAGKKSMNALDWWRGIQNQNR